jgi:uncharacterized LabA/DUF88 family protein
VWIKGLFSEFDCVILCLLISLSSRFAGTAVFVYNRFMARVIIFIDGNNFYHKLKKVALIDKSLLDFQYNNFGKKIIDGDDLVEIRYYLGAIKRQHSYDREKSEKLYRGQQQLLGKLQTQKVTTIMGSLIQHPDKTFHEKGVDVRVAVEMIRLAREDKYDKAYLISSDTDLVSAVEEVKSFGKAVTYVGFPSGQSFGLTKACESNVILLRAEDLNPFLPNTLV